MLAAMDLLTLAELLALVKMLADLVLSIDHINSVLERHIERRLLHPPIGGDPVTSAVG